MKYKTLAWKICDCVVFGSVVELLLRVMVVVKGIGSRGLLEVVAQQVFLNYGGFGHGWQLLWSGLSWGFKIVCVWISSIFVLSVYVRGGQSLESSNSLT